MGLLGYAIPVLFQMKDLRTKTGKLFSGPSTGPCLRRGELCSGLLQGKEPKAGSDLLCERRGGDPQGQV